MISLQLEVKRLEIETITGSAKPAKASDSSSRDAVARLRRLDPDQPGRCGNVDSAGLSANGEDWSVSPGERCTVYAATFKR